ncbi:MAG TPA: hypothetical protein VFP30_03710 [Candidatus Limnocylindria bacterium]|nr:hypothetical protein [Candidatus Limnocylindria bacterium]
MELPDPSRLLFVETRAQDVAKEMVVAVPLPPVVERHEEQVASIEGLKHGRRVVSTSNGVTDRTREPIEDRSLQQEASDVIGLPSEDLLDEVVDDVTIPAGKARDEAGGIVPALHGEGSQLKRCNPPFGSLRECRDIDSVEIQSHYLI